MNAVTRLKATAVNSATPRELREKATDDSYLIIDEALAVERILEGSIKAAGALIMSKLGIRTIPRGMGSGPALRASEVVRALENQTVVCNFGSTLDEMPSGAVTKARGRLSVDMLEAETSEYIAANFMDDYKTKDLTVTAKGTLLVLTSKV